MGAGKLLSAAIALALTAQTATANCAADAMVVFDASASMTSQDFTASPAQRIHEARQAVAQVAPEVDQIRRIGLVIYGPGGASGCDGIDLRFAPAPSAAARLVQEVEGVAPGGLTPLTAAVRLAAEALDASAQPGVVVLVTDGNESCGGSPCRLAETFATEAPGLIVHVIGFKVVWDAFASHGDSQTPFYGAEILARCLADRTGGTYASTENLEDLVDALRKTLGCPVFG